MILALGPVLHIGGQTALLPAESCIPLPHAGLVRVVPFMDISRSVSRFDAMVMLALAVLAPLGLDWVVRRLPGPRPAGRGRRHRADRVRVPAGPLSDEPARHTGLVHDAGERARPGAVLNLPMNWDRPDYLLHQTVHGKPLTAAISAGMIRAR